MDDKIERFLKSIKLNNIERFDMSFDMVGRNRFDRDTINMIILKETPWEYELANEFIEALNNINYKYTLQFTYRKHPDSDNVVALLHDWYQSIYRVPLDLKIVPDKNDYIHIDYISEEEKEKFSPAINDFKEYLKFLSYDFVIIDTVKPYAKVSEEEKQVLEEAASASIEPKVDLEEVAKKNNEDHQKVIEDVGDDISKIIENNMKQLKIDRERMRLNKRGGYRHVEFIDSLDSNSGNIDLTAKVFWVEEENIKLDTARIRYGLVDEKGACINFRIRFKNNQYSTEEIKHIKRGSNVRVRGVVGVDRYTNELYIYGHLINLIEPDVIAPDEAEVKRVELHCHTNMSAQDGLADADSLFSYAKALGHKALAITDHAVVQAFPAAEHASEKSGVKAIYGCEFNLVEDKPTYIYNPCKTPINNAKYVVLDLESTGLSTRYDKIIEFGAQKYESGRIVDSLDIMVNPGELLSDKIVDLTGIDDDMLKDAKSFKEVMNQIIDFIGDAIIVTHNASFDYPLLKQEILRNGGPELNNPVIDTLNLFLYLTPGKRSHNLGALCKFFKVDYDKDSAHRADYDAEVLGNCWMQMIYLFTEKNHDMTHEELASLPMNVELLTQIRGRHCIAIAKNKAGLRDLYELVSLSHVKYLAGQPKVPKSELVKRRKNLIIGSACLNGEVFRSARYDCEEKLKETISFYDYVELQPLENYSCLYDLHELTKERIIQYHEDIIKCADELNIPVVATGDVHYIKKEEKIFREIFIGAPVIGGGNHPLKPRNEDIVKYGEIESPNQHFRTTNEMLEAFSYLDKDKAFEIVVTNSNTIADMVEPLVIIPKKQTFAPNIEGVNDILASLARDSMHRTYGENPDPEIVERCETELAKIIDSGYAVVYYYAHMIVKKANEDGFIAGSRGSVGSSFVATLCGITEVNPLRPHYVCPKCHHFEWSDKEFPEAKSGYDLPDKVCPVCGEKMINEGQDIPFETFLGAEGEKKVPDIDLNFAGDYQQKAHNYCRELLGRDHIFRAGTIGKTAFDSSKITVKKYLEAKNIPVDSVPKAKLDFLTAGCVDVKRSTGKHAGGVIVIPLDRDVNEFTPIQYPADKADSDWCTTHFDFNSMHDMLLKFDLLGQFEPQVIKFCCDLTGTNVFKIPLNDRKVFSLFTSTYALNMKRNYMNQKTGALALPEFGTNFVRQMIEKTKPTTFQQLVVIQGLSHGTDVWTGNAEDLIDQGVTDINGIIGCRDDIMIYLQSMGLSKGNAFKIMETVRKKDKFLSPEQKELMQANNVPAWWMESADKIKYLFPKAHAAAYTIMALRTGYFKVYHPLAYYAAYFSIKADKFDISSMIKGEKEIIAKIEELQAKSKGFNNETISATEEDVLECLYVALEMTQRGYSFRNIDLYQSDYLNFKVDKETKSLVPPFRTLNGLGEAVAFSITEARKDGTFYSIEDLKSRTKLTTSNINALKELGVLDDLDETDQMSLF